MISLGQPQVIDDGTAWVNLWALKRLRKELSEYLEHQAAHGEHAAILRQGKIQPVSDLIPPVVAKIMELS